MVQKMAKSGLALVLGPVSDVFVIDVDGPEAHSALMERLGGDEPPTVKALSGSGEPYRYHLFFRCPDVATKAKQTPWHPKLEFRGQGGIVIIPPSLHKSGKHYAWEEDRSPADLDLLEVPERVRQALKPMPPARAPASTTKQFTKSLSGIDASPRTREFLSGKWADGPGWNDRLFRAACDLHGRGMAIEKAEPLLMNGARPWSLGEEQLARRSIQSAFSQPRKPARY